MSYAVIVYSIVGGVCRRVSVEVENLKEIRLFDKEIKTLDNICDISFAKDMVILQTDSPRYRYAPKPNPEYKPDYAVNNYVNAYDYNGNHLWNISQIIGDVGSGISGGHICSTDYLLEESKDSYVEGHELFVCWDEYGMRYLIDLDEKKVIHKILTR
ncbi:MAG: hypothetical protein IJV82_01580 [Oscillospiraceae bacterium]|nr:hypothetical protein [Oscillospiraceae bacterium]